MALILSLNSNSLINKTRSAGKRLPPAVLALLIQCLSVLLAVLPAAAIFPDINLLEGLILQAVITVLLSYCFRLAWWWYLIQPLFPLAIVAMLFVALPSWLYLLVFCCLLFVFWSTFRTQVPYYPSSQKVWEVVLPLVSDLVKDKGTVSVMDIGSGLGGLVLYLAGHYPQSRFVGVEIAPFPWLFSYLRTLGRQNQAQFLRTDYQKMDFSQFDLVFAYLSPAVMTPLWNKAQTEMRPGSLLVSYEFIIDGVAPDLSICLDKKQGNGAKVYIWTMK